MGLAYSQQCLDVQNARKKFPGSVFGVKVITLAMKETRGKSESKENT